jgi:hypothetical protein
LEKEAQPKAAPFAFGKHFIINILRVTSLDPKI